MTFPSSSNWKATEQEIHLNIDNAFVIADVAAIYP